MRTYSTIETRNKFSEIIDIARREPVGISKHGRVVSIILAKEDYDRYVENEEERWMSYKTIPADDVTDEINDAIKKFELNVLNAKDL
jgi:prevent-host-death family protein